jgi:hypothetical protein
MRLPGRGPDAISPTAHYTGYVWARNGLSHPELESWQGRALFEATRPSMLVFGALGGPTLETYLLTRHRALDDLLESWIDEHPDAQVLEAACGLSPRGWRFTSRRGERLTYVEADLPDMAARKRNALERMGSLSERHRVVDLDVLREDGPGRYFSDLHVAEDASGPHVEAFRLLLSAFVRGQVRVHFEDADEAVEALRDAGFADPAVRATASVVRIVDAGPHPRAA